ncbi:MAG: hypothetical protein FJ399_10905, partial [Verrucomicrobia bacterium]|nr:hypothetical protein [Verrucomicrobiota bacterium]
MITIQSPELKCGFMARRDRVKTACTRRGETGGKAGVWRSGIAAGAEGRQGRWAQSPMRRLSPQPSTTGTWCPSLLRRFGDAWFLRRAVSATALIEREAWTQVLRPARRPSAPGGKASSLRCVRVGLVGLLSLVAFGVAGAAERQVEPPAPRSLAELRARIEAQVGQARFRGALWSVRVDSLMTGKTLIAHHPDRLMSPASNSKLYTGALALDVLGPEYRIVTPIFATGRPDGAGVLRGNVVVRGRGDPGWKSENRRDDFWRIFDPFVEVLQKAGVRRIAGDLVADATHFRG